MFSGNFGSFMRPWAVASCFRPLKMVIMSHVGRLWELCKKTGEEQWKGQMFDLSNRVSVKILTRLSVTNMATFRTSVDQQPWPPPSPASRFPGHIGLLGSLGPLWPSWGSLRRLLGRCWGPLGPLKLSWAVLGSVWAVVGSSWGPLGPSCGDLGGLWDRVGPSWVLAPISSRAQPWPNSAPPQGAGQDNDKGGASASVSAYRLPLGRCRGNDQILPPLLLLLLPVLPPSSPPLCNWTPLAGAHHEAKAVRARGGTGLPRQNAQPDCPTKCQTKCPTKLKGQAP